MKQTREDMKQTLVMRNADGAGLLTDLFKIKDKLKEKALEDFNGELFRLAFDMNELLCNLDQKTGGHYEAQNSIVRQEKDGSFSYIDCNNQKKTLEKEDSWESQLATK